MSFEAGISAGNLTGSLMSCMATAAVLVSFVLYRKEQRTFRHALILNLTLAEFINSLNNSISGIINLHDRGLQAGLPCVVNGFVGQLSVQAADFGILAIAVVSLLTVTRRVYLPDAAPAKKVLLSLSVWIVPIFTSIFAVTQGAMTPVAGNWCWITAARPDLRYALTHGWRFAIIFGTIIIYSYMWWYMTHHFNTLVQADRTGHSEGSGTNDSCQTGASEPQKPTPKLMSPKKTEHMEYGMPAGGNSREDSYRVLAPQAGVLAADSKEILNREIDTFNAGRRTASFQLQKPPPARRVVRNNGPGFGISHFHKDLIEPTASPPQSEPRPPEWPKTGGRRSTVLWQLPSAPASPRSPWTRSPPSSPRKSRLLALLPARMRQSIAPGAQAATLMTNASEFPMRRQTRKVEREIKRMMLLNAYPILYVLLSVPGLVNRLLEAITGVKAPSATSQALQIPTQFIGLANALTYGFNKHLRHRIRGDWRLFRRRRSAAL